MKCGKEYSKEILSASDNIPICSCGGIIRPHVTLYEEALDTDTSLEAIDEISTADTLIIGGTSLAVYPAAAMAWLRVSAPHLSKECVVIDLCGTKRGICGTCFGMAKEYGFTFVGGHPMAGTQYSGFENSKNELFRGAPMVIVPPEGCDESTLTRARELLAPVGFGTITVSTAEKHDRIIAFTSQLAHVVSNAYVKSPNAQVHKGFSAGSYKDLTRVAWLNEQMWTELFMENSDYLTEEIDGIINALTAYRDAMAAGDASRLKALLRDGREAKERVDRGSEDKV
jgi:prephenate dehydrogenase